MIRRKGANEAPAAAPAKKDITPTKVGRDLAWPWMLAAALLWGMVLLLPRSDEPTPQEGLILIGAVTATVAAALVYTRRNVTNVAEAAAAAALAAVAAAQQQAFASQASAPAAPAPAPTPTPAPNPPPAETGPGVSAAMAAEVLDAPLSSPAPPPAPQPEQPVVAAPRPDRLPGMLDPPIGARPKAPSEVSKGDLLRPCPCGFCDTMVEDANGYLTAVTAWVIAVERLCKQASEAMVKGGWVHLPVYEFASDTEALKELLVQTCHEGGGTRAIWTIQGLVTVWEQTLFRVEQEIAATVEPGRYLAWHTATADIRASRHGD